MSTRRKSNPEHLLTILAYLKEQNKPICTQQVAKDLYGKLIKPNPEAWTSIRILENSWACFYLNALHKLDYIAKIKNGTAGCRVYWEYKQGIKQ